MKSNCWMKIIKWNQLELKPMRCSTLADRNLSPVLDLLGDDDHLVHLLTEWWNGESRGIKHQKNLFISSFITEWVYRVCLGSNIREWDRWDQAVSGLVSSKATKNNSVRNQSPVFWSDLGVVQTEARSWLGRGGVWVDAHNERLLAS